MEFQEDCAKLPEQYSSSTNEALNSLEYVFQSFVRSYTFAVNEEKVQNFKKNYGKKTKEPLKKNQEIFQKHQIIREKQCPLLQKTLQLATEAEEDPSKLN